MIEELERMVCIERGIKLSIKAKAIKDEALLDSFLELLFSREEKTIVSATLNDNFGLP